MLKFNQLFHGGCNGFFAGPLSIGVQTLVIGIWQHQRLVVVTVKPYLAALPQQKASKITKLLCIFLTCRFIHGVILVVFNHDTGKTNSVFLRQLHQIRPPDFAVKVADAHAVISADIGAITAGNRRRKIVQIEHGTVNDRVSSGIA